MRIFQRLRNLDTFQAFSMSTCVVSIALLLLMLNFA